jgi:chitodextrinase
VLVIQDCGGFVYDVPWLSGDNFLTGAKQMATIPGTNKVADVARMMGTTFQVSNRISAADDPSLTNQDSGYGNLQWITQQLVQTALLIKAGVPAQSYTMGFGPFDSHSDQKQLQIDRFTELNEALSKFFAVLAGHARQNDVFVLITSEFGRQGTANEDNGTDHGQAGMAMFIGGGVKRGIFGQAPTLDPGGPTRPNRISDALKPTVDFRSVHATVLTRLAKGDANVSDAVLKAHFEDLGVFAPVSPPTTTTTRLTTTTTSTTIANAAPTAAMALSKLTGPMPLSITANGSGSKDLDGTIAKYAWRWGDGTAASFGKTASHKFTKRGSFTVRLTVTDNKGAVGTVTKTVKVT